MHRSNREIKVGKFLSLISQKNFIALATLLILFLIPLTVYSALQLRTGFSQAAACYDFNGDGRVDTKDRDLLIDHFGIYQGQPNYDPKYDLNGDGTVTSADVAVINSHLGETCPPTANLSASRTSITRGESTTLSWTTYRADTVSISPGIGAVAKSGSRSVTPSSTTTYTLTATGPGGVVSKSKTITVSVPPPPSPTPTPTPNPTLNLPRTRAPRIVSPNSGASAVPPPAGDKSITFLKILINPVQELSGGLPVTISIKGTKFKETLTLYNTTGEIRTSVKRGILRQNATYTLQVSGDKILTRRVKFTAKDYKPSIKAGTLYLGDLNKDNKITNADVDIMFENFSEGSRNDLNFDSVLNSLDYSILIKNLGKVGS
ncbi:MAG: dockerin type I domain-containing protein [Candidatus Woykebacteria bacterium]